MHNRRMFVLFGLILASSFGFFVTKALASKPFSITATNVTFTESGNDNTEVTISGIPGDGTILIGCSYSGPATKAKMPACECVVPHQITVEGGQTITESIGFCPYGTPMPAALNSAPGPQGHHPAAGLSLAGVLMLGFGLWRKARRWLILAVFAIGALAGLAGISACSGGSSNGATPGIYQYTITAGWTSSSPAILSMGTSTTMNVTVR